MSPVSEKDDSAFMRVALRMARKGLGRTSPNPPVGAVVVRRGVIVGRGYHRRLGAAHGEAEALADAGSRARGGTLYVTLEPCNHSGRRPPCTETVIASGVSRVVIGTADPNPNVAGGGAKRIRRAGVEVAAGVEEGPCRELIAPFTKVVSTGLPYVSLKLAATLDGRIATRHGESRWVTGERARRLVHRWRDEMDAIMVGAGTVLADDPLLTCRRRGGRDPLRVIVDGRLRVPVDARVLTKDLAAGTLIATCKSSGRKINKMQSNGVQVETFAHRGNEISLKALLRRLARRGISSVLLEGGGVLAAGALRCGVVDRILCILAPTLVGGDGVAMLGSLGVERLADAQRLSDVRVSRLGEDLLIDGTFGGRHG